MRVTSGGDPGQLAGLVGCGAAECAALHRVARIAEDQRGSRLVLRLPAAVRGVVERVDRVRRPVGACRGGGDTGVEPHAVAGLHAAAAGAVDDLVAVLPHDAHRRRGRVGHEQSAAAHRDVGESVVAGDRADDDVVGSAAGRCRLALAVVLLADAVRRQVAEVGVRVVACHTADQGIAVLVGSEEDGRLGGHALTLADTERGAAVEHGVDDLARAIAGDVDALEDLAVQVGDEDLRPVVVPEGHVDAAIAAARKGRLGDPEKRHRTLGAPVDDADVPAAGGEDVGGQVALLGIGEHAVQASEAAGVGQHGSSGVAVAVVLGEILREHVKQVARTDLTVGAAEGRGLGAPIELACDVLGVPDPQVGALGAGPRRSGDRVRLVGGPHLVAPGHLRSAVRALAGPRILRLGDRRCGEGGGRQGHGCGGGAADPSSGHECSWARGGRVVGGRTSGQQGAAVRASTRPNQGRRDPGANAL